ncbi:FAD-dependent monooxygenase [Agromyces seonyuensis]|uniref:2-polyprenyl-6-methoxyphenol hydroxylase n=1 Tax=Agromyces seonyuensis TaxID=2662446 RepID=A0A6I4NWW8_9MICO|nr:FAD-dependent monooxygenase [Agromyces seonyuensis]MWB98886.1 2-polyprenyl-6-methoxyphenol hydroxylase [Agromyces seonyuensis]
MTAVSKVAIAGSGAAALAAAIPLAEAGVAVDVFELKTETSTLGSGITLQGNALRALHRLGVWDAVQKRGYTFEGLTLRAPGPGAPVIAELPEIKTGGADFPACMGMYRPDLARILVDRALEVGVRIHYGSKVTGVRQTDTGVLVDVGGAPVGEFDLLIGADGLHSTVRHLIGIETKPEPTGMGIWRAFVRRPAEVTQSQLYYGGPMYIAGYTPTGEDTCYAFLVEDAQDRFDVPTEDAVELMRAASAAYGGPWEEIRASLGADSRVNYTWFTSHLVEGAWNRGRTVVIGDAAHSCPPTVAQGAAQALEDGTVLAELLLAADAVDEGLWAEFHARRVPRASAVVEASVQLGKWQLEHNRDADAAGLIFGISQQMAVPA